MSSVVNLFARHLAFQALLQGFLLGLLPGILLRFLIRLVSRRTVLDYFKEHLFHSQYKNFDFVCYYMCIYKFIGFFRGYSSCASL